MKYLLTILCLLFGTAFAANIYIARDADTNEAEHLFKEKVNTGMLFTTVPRGLIVSIDETVFFRGSSEKIRQSGTKVLDEIGGVLNLLGRDCVIEGHTETANPIISAYKSNWELSLARANNITKYLMRCVKVSPSKVSALGFGEFMPFNDNVSEKAGINNRIDFVILYYKQLGNN